MGWEIGWDANWKRDIGYGVPATCDFPGCNEVIDRGLSYVCGGDAYGGSRGCGLYFCPKHLEHSERLPQLCPRCKRRRTPFDPKPDLPKWIRHKLTHQSWGGMEEPPPGGGRRHGRPTQGQTRQERTTMSRVFNEALRLSLIAEVPPASRTRRPARQRKTPPWAKGRQSAASEYFPKRPIWLVFDLCNGHAPVRRYVWWFDTRKDALDHLEHHRKNPSQTKVDLSKPVRFYPKPEGSRSGTKGEKSS